MNWLAVILLVLSPAALYGLILLIAASVSAIHPPRCPNCGRRSFRCVNFLRAFANLQRKPFCWAYYRCNQCGNTMKRNALRGEWVAVSEEEKRQYCR